VSDTLDVITLAEAHKAINLPDDAMAHDVAIAALVTAISQGLDDMAGPIVQRTITDEPHDGGCTSLGLRHAPVVSVASVTEYSGTVSLVLTAESNAVKTSSNFYFDPVTSRVYRRAGGWDYMFAQGRGNVLVTYVAGRATSTATVASKFKEAAKLTCLHLWKPKSGQWAQSMPQFGGDAVPATSPVPGWAFPRAALDLIRNDLKTDGFA